VTDTALDVANLGVQVFGGYGYVTDSGMEQYVRDVRVAAIYEGTNGIQAIDLVARKLLGDGGARLQHYVARMRADIALHREQSSLTGIRAATQRGADLLENISRQMIERGAANKQSPDLEAGAAAYLKLAGVVGGAWMWLRIAGCSSGGSALHRLNRSTAEFYAKVLSAEAALYAEQCLTGAAATALDEEQWLVGQ
jgi:acyl-CoA dehydrogenase